VKRSMIFLLRFSNKGSEDIPNAKAMFDGREEDFFV